MNTWNLRDLASLALSGGMDTFVPDAEHINALPEPVRRYIRDLETRADPAGDVAELALLKENNMALWKRVQELEAEVNGLRGDPGAATPDLAVELQRVYDSEINMQIGWLWDGGVEVRLGDDMNGYEAAVTLESVRETLPWLQEAIAHFYPDSTMRRRLIQRLVSGRETDSSSRRASARAPSARIAAHPMPDR
jgi:hypothetical protein